MTIDFDMTAERLIHFLENPKQLRGISYQELKSWSDLYPFCQNLRYLVVQKSKMDQQKEYPKDLELAATYSIDRSLLHQQIELNQFKYTEPEDTLDLEEDALVLQELQDLPEMETIELEPIQATASTPPSDSFEFVIPDVAAEEPILDIRIDDDSIEYPVIETKLEEDEAPKESISNEKELHDITIIERLLSDVPNENMVEETSNNNIIEEKNIAPPIDLSDESEEMFSTENNEEDDLIDIILNTTTDEVESEIIAESDLGEMAPRNTEENTLSHEENIHAENTHEVEIIPEDHAEELENLTDLFPIVEEIVVSEVEQVSSEQNMEGDELSKKEEISKPLPASKQSFSSWLKNYQQTKPEQASESPIIENKATKSKEEAKADKRNKKIKKLIKANKKKLKVKKKKKTKAKETDLANKSIIDSEEVISQTLADLLAAQGYSDKAIKMYERLSLIFPEKSSFFADKIKELSYFNE